MRECERVCVSRGGGGGSEWLAGVLSSLMDRIAGGGEGAEVFDI